MQNNLNTQLKPQRIPLVLFIYFALALICLLVFGQVRNFDFINYDDSLYVYENPRVPMGLTLDNITWAFTTSYFGYWQPLTWSSLMLDCQLFGVNPGWMHLVNLFWHVVNTLLLFEVLRRMTGSLWSSVFVAAAFAIHPMHVESVAWISERKDVLSTFFMLITLAAYAGYVKRPSVYRYIAALVFFVLGLMAKPMLVTLPFVLLLLDYWPLKRFEMPGHSASGGCQSQQSTSILCRQGVLYRLMIEKVPFVICSVISSIVSFLTQQVANVIPDTQDIPVMSRIGDILLSYAFYMEKFFWPTNLALPYSTTAGGDVLWVQCTLCILVLVGVTFLVLYFGRTIKYLPVGWLWFIGSLVPVIGFVRFTGASYADRFTYVPYTGLFIMLAWGLPQLLSKRPYHRVILGLSMVLVLSALGLCSHRQVSYWKNSISLLSHTIKVTQDNWIAYCNLGMAYNGLARYPEALEAYRQGIRIKPDYAQTYNNLGLTYHSLKRYPEAIEAFDRSIQLEPDLVEPYNNLGKLYADLGDSQKAAEFFNMAIRIKPDDPEVNHNLGAAYYNLGRHQDAIEAYQKSIRFKPDYASAYIDLGTVYGDLERYPEAIEAYRQAVKIDPQNARAYCNLGAVYYVLGQLPETIQAFRQATKIDPAYAKAHFSLGLAYLEFNGKEAALKEYEILKTLNADMAGKLYEMINP